MTVKELFSATVRTLEEAGIDEARRNAEWMLQEVLHVGRAGLFAHPDRTVPPDAVACVEEMTAQRVRHEPIQYILGYTEFFGVRFQVSPDVLIPRPETEQVVERALALAKPVPQPRVLDIGTGSGCISAVIKHERPDADVYACDVSEQVLAVARRNAAQLGLSITFLQADIFSVEAVGALPHDLDLLVSNPPYIPDHEAPALGREVAGHEPHQALFSGEDPLRFYRRIVGLAHGLLRPGGYLIFETHASYGHDVGRLLQGEGLSGVQVENDLAGLPRIAFGQITP